MLIVRKLKTTFTLLILIALGAALFFYAAPKHPAADVGWREPFPIDGQLKLDLALVELFKISPSDQIGACNSFIGAKRPSQTLDIPSRKNFFTEKGWQQYLTFVNAIKTILPEDAYIGLFSVDEQKLFSRQAGNKYVYQLKIQTYNNTCDSSGHNDLDLSIFFSWQNHGGEPGFQIDEWKIQKMPTKIIFSVMY